MVTRQVAARGTLEAEMLFPKGPIIGLHWHAGMLLGQIKAMVTRKEFVQRNKCALEVA